ncbi:Hypothetical protein SCF082_LOCUS15242, partial [Durusdinium trenchii]
MPVGCREERSTAARQFVALWGDVARWRLQGFACLPPRRSLAGRLHGLGTRYGQWNGGHADLLTERFSKAALQRLANEEPHSFRITEHISGQRITLEEATTGRSLQCHCADFFSMGLDLVQNCDVIFFAVNIPWKLFQQLCQRLTEVKEGCRLFTYHRLDTVWWTEDPCPFHQVE